MRVEAKLGAVRQTTGREHLTRFVLGGLVTVAAGLVAQRFGPVWGGLFLAFPSIFPATATLLETHEKRKKQAAHMDGALRGREAAALDAFGSALGSIGLFAFALTVWLLLPHHPALPVILLSSTVWLVVVSLLWWVRKR